VTPNNKPREVFNAEALGLRLYRGTAEEDVLLAYWYDHLSKTKDLNLVTTKSSRTLHGFLSMFQPSNFLTYSLFEDDSHPHDPIEFAGWFAPEQLSNRGFYYSNWAHESIRGKRRQLYLSAAVYDAAFTFADVLIGITKQKHLLPIHHKIGYTYAGAIPYMFDSDPAYILYLTKKSYEASKTYKLSHKEK